MAKVKQRLKFRLPEYVSSRNAWRKKIHATALKAAKEQGVEYGPEVKLAVEVKLYLRGRALEIHDVDNRSEAKIGRFSDQLIPERSGYRSPRRPTDIGLKIFSMRCRAGWEGVRQFGSLSPSSSTIGRFTA